MRNKSSAWVKAKKFGIDTTLLEINLKKTPTERILALQDALTFAMLLRRAGAVYYAKLRKTH